ncbi:hypothetical protein HOE37_04990 [Candidatus Woesearchaeota archaeon]|jgi:hypothetical protein|nr:hypothetical protein [Candidatus Woesearchaeota archaeon]MBT4336768.1 hypothetical protein [Candidatus Woesearchaeota archaeon]MBT4469436.1 hypothetical protein [Candidatus Woesearchaeota archaeon]MBT6744169.1 hypothetical protein [Candidatus Woesearchaeota archaeon]
MRLALNQILPELEKEEHFVHIDINNHLFIQLAKTEGKRVEKLCYFPENKIMYIPITTGIVNGLTLKKLADQFGPEKAEHDATSAKLFLAETKKYWTAPKREVLEEAISQEARTVCSDINRYNRNKLEELYQSILGWNVLEACTEAYAESFRKDSIILERHNLVDLTEEYKALASFNRKVSAQAGYGAKRTERFIQEYENTWRFRGLEKPKGDFEEIKNKVVEEATTHFTK